MKYAYVYSCICREGSIRAEHTEHAVVQRERICTRSPILLYEGRMHSYKRGSKVHYRQLSAAPPKRHCGPRED